PWLVGAGALASTKHVLAPYLQARRATGQMLQPGLKTPLHLDSNAPSRTAAGDAMLEGIHAERAKPRIGWMGGLTATGRDTRRPRAGSFTRNEVKALRRHALEKNPQLGQFFGQTWGPRLAGLAALLGTGYRQEHYSPRGYRSGHSDINALFKPVIE